MLIPSYTKQFVKDIKRMEKRGKSPEKIKKVIKKLVNGDRLDVNYKDHKLTISPAAQLVFVTLKIVSL